MNPDVMRVQELFVQLFDKDDSKDDFLGEASVMLGEYMSRAGVTMHLMSLFMS